MDKYQRLISVTENPGSVLRTYATILRTPAGEKILQFSTTLSNAKDPDAHQIKYQILFKNSAEADEFINFVSSHL